MCFYSAVRVQLGQSTLCSNGFPVAQFADGVYLVLLMGLLEGYFVPLYSFSLTPETFEDKVHNIRFAFELMVDAGLPEPKPRPEGLLLSCVFLSIFSTFMPRHRRLLIFISIVVFFHVFVCSLLLPCMLKSLLRCVWECRRYTIQPMQCPSAATIECEKLWGRYHERRKDFFQGEALGDFSWGAKVVKFDFSHKKLRKQPFLLNMSRSKCGPRLPSAPPSDTHERCYASSSQ